MTARALVLAMSAALAACTVGPDYVKPDLKLPARWSEENTGTPTQAVTGNLDDWWAQFHDPVLTELIDAVIAGNLQLQIARQHLAQARAERIVAGAGGVPPIDASILAQRANSSTTLEWPPGNGQYSEYLFGFNASWEWDVFGGRKRAEQAADADIDAAIEDRRAIVVVLLSELATEYASLRATQVRVTIAEQNLAAAREVFELMSTE